MLELREQFIRTMAKLGSRVSDVDRWLQRVGNYIDEDYQTIGYSLKWRGGCAVYIRLSVWGRDKYISWGDTMEFVMPQNMDGKAWEHLSRKLDDYLNAVCGKLEECTLEEKIAFFMGE